MDTEHEPDDQSSNSPDDDRSRGFAGNRAESNRRGRKRLDGAATPDADQRGAGQGPAPLPSGERKEIGLEAGEAGTAPQGRLGITARSASPEDAKKGERAERFRHLRVAHKLITWRGKKAKMQFPMDWHKTGTCHWNLLGSHATVYWMSGYRAVWRGVVICGKVWACPICAPKIQEQRRREIDHAMNWYYRFGQKAVMLTLTVPHKRWHEVADLLEKQQAALTQLRSGKRAKELREKIGHVGMIRALELTHGRNGWHPHTHELWFVADDQPEDEQAAAAWVDAFRAEVLAQWQTACIAAGLLDPGKPAQMKTFRRRSVDVVDRVSRGAYLAKIADPTTDGSEDQRTTEPDWGADRELAMATIKEGRKNGLTPQQMLTAAGESESAKAKRRAGAIWLDEIDALRGRPWLYWSQGLKKCCGIDESSDEDVAESDEDEEIPILCLDAEAWKVVRDQEDGRSDVLHIVEDGMEAGASPAVIAEVIQKLVRNFGSDGRVWVPDTYRDHGDS